MGDTTAVLRTVKLPTKLLVQLPGQHGEHLAIKKDDAKVASMAEVIRKRGGILGPTGKPYRPFVNVDYKGRASMNEGNHRVRAYFAAGKKSVPVEIAYFAGGEKRKGPASLVTVIKYNTPKRKR